MKVPHTLVVLAVAGFPGFLSAQEVIDTSGFFDPAFSVRQPGATTGLLSVTATNVPFSNSGASGDMAWNHSAGGLIQARTGLDLGLTQLELDAQLFASTRTTGTSLVFGRDIALDANVLGLPLDPTNALNDLLNTLVAANAVYNWSAEATLGGLDLQANQLYQISFDVTAAGGLPAGVIESLTFGIDDPTVSGEFAEDATLLSLGGIVDLGSGDGSSGQFTFVFQSSSDLSELNMSFAADSVVGANLLGGTGALDYITFENLAIVAVPEPSGAALAGLAGAFLLIRRRR